MNIVKSTEVRTVNAVHIEADSHFFFGGRGHQRVNINDGQPQVLNARRVGGSVSGQMTGNVKIVEIKGANDWFSLRDTGMKGSRHTVYVKGDTLVVIDGTEHTLRDLYHNA